MLFNLRSLRVVEVAGASPFPPPLPTDGQHGEFHVGVGTDPHRRRLCVNLLARFCNTVVRGGHARANV